MLTHTRCHAIDVTFDAADTTAATYFTIATPCRLFATAPDMLTPRYDAHCRCRYAAAAIHTCQIITPLPPLQAQRYHTLMSHAIVAGIDVTRHADIDVTLLIHMRAAVMRALLQRYAARQQWRRYD